MRTPHFFFEVFLKNRLFSRCCNPFFLGFSNYIISLDWIKTLIYLAISKTSKKPIYNFSSSYTILSFKLGILCLNACIHSVYMKICNSCKGWVEHRWGLSMLSCNSHHIAILPGILMKDIEMLNFMSLVDYHKQYFKMLEVQDCKYKGGKFFFPISHPSSTLGMNIITQSYLMY